MEQSHLYLFIVIFQQFSLYWFKFPSYYYKKIKSIKDYKYYQNLLKMNSYFIPTYYFLSYKNLSYSIHLQIFVGNQQALNSMGMTYLLVWYFNFPRIKFDCEWYAYLLNLYDKEYQFDFQKFYHFHFISLLITDLNFLFSR